MKTLTDRYVAATLRSVPEKSRGDLERELRASIGDAVDARTAKGETSEAAESAVLTELGDPDTLAAAYSGPPKYLIGPRVYHAYTHTLTIVLAFSVPIVSSLFLAVWVAAGDSIVPAVLRSLAVALFVGLMAAFWTTVGYLVVDRSEEARQALAEAAGDWTPSRLPTETSTQSIRVGDAVQAIVGGSIGIALIFIQRSVSPFQDASGAPIPVLNPSLWSLWIPLFITIAILWMAIEFVKLARGAWSVPLAIATTVVAIASSGIEIYVLGTGQMFNPAFFEKFLGTGWVAAGSPLILLAIFFNLVDCGTRVMRAWVATLGFRSC